MAVKELTLAKSRFNAMGTKAQVFVTGSSDSELIFAEEFLRSLEKKWSRFIPTSEISRLNAAGGRTVVVSPETVGLVSRAVFGSLKTNGLFDPTVLSSMESLGYDRTFKEIPISDENNATLLKPAYGVREIAISEAACAITLPVGCGFDPGGIGKGFAADLLAEELFKRGAAGACINIGGDVRVIGVGPDDGAWSIGIENLEGIGDPVATLLIRDGGLATTSNVGRQWLHDGELVNHLVDPRTGQSVPMSPSAITAITGEAWWAEVWSKALFVGGPAVWEAAEKANVSVCCVDENNELKTSESAGEVMSWVSP